MNESKHDHKSHGDPNGGPINHGQPPIGDARIGTGASGSA